jgi:hypothetical protein
MITFLWQNKEKVKGRQLAAFGGLWRPSDVTPGAVLPGERVRSAFPDFCVTTAAV